jgi:excisionase family DNA binding protein
MRRTMVQQLITTEEVAKRLGTNVDTIRRWVRDGRIPAIRMGGRFIRLDWDAVMASMKRPTEAQS